MSVLSWATLSEGTYLDFDVPTVASKEISISSAASSYITGHAMKVLTHEGFANEFFILKVDSEDDTAIRSGAPTHDQLKLSGAEATAFWADIVKSSDKRYFATYVKLANSLLELGYCPKLNGLFSDPIQKGAKDNLMRSILTYAIRARGDTAHLVGVCWAGSFLSEAEGKVTEAIFKKVLGDSGPALAEVFVRAMKAWAKTIPIESINAIAEDNTKSVEALVGDAVGKALHKGVIMTREVFEKKLANDDKDLRGYAKGAKGNPLYVGGSIKVDVAAQRRITVSRPGGDKVHDNEQEMLGTFEKIYRYAIGGDELQRFKECKTVAQKVKLLKVLKEHRAFVDEACKRVTKVLGERDRKVRSSAGFISGVAEKGANLSAVYAKVAGELKESGEFVEMKTDAIIRHTDRATYLETLVWEK